MQRKPDVELLNRHSISTVPLPPPRILRRVDHDVRRPANRCDRSNRPRGRRRSGNCPHIMRVAPLHNSRWLPLVLASWAAVVALGLFPLARYQFTQGDPGAPPADWPEASAIRRMPGRPTLVIFTHAECPCTRASLSELEQIQSHCTVPFAAYVVAFHPEKSPDRLPPVLPGNAAADCATTFMNDNDNREAMLFHAKTSGQVVLYGNDGRLVFSGGITGSRGHVGDNPGRAAVESLLKGEPCSVRTTNVFGCSLLSRRAERKNN